jgi:Protein of unknown function, DUF488
MSISPNLAVSGGACEAQSSPQMPIGDYALTAPFAAGMARLRERGSRHRCAIMCAEAVWWRCHRRIIADYLLAAGERVMHILGTSQVDEAHLTPGAVLRNDGTVVYPAESP